eukprot:5546758-Pleurochrysis_carterae.AAC.1
MDTLKFSAREHGAWSRAGGSEGWGGERGRENSSSSVGANGPEASQLKIGEGPTAAVLNARANRQGNAHTHASVATRARQFASDAQARSLAGARLAPILCSSPCALPVPNSRS